MTDKNIVIASDNIEMVEQLTKYNKNKRGIVIIAGSNSNHQLAKTIADTLIGIAEIVEPHEFTKHDHSQHEYEQFLNKKNNKYIKYKSKKKM